MADLSIDKDYPLSLTDVRDRAGNPAPYEGAPIFEIDNPDVGVITITSGDPRVPDGTILLVTGTVVGAGANLTCKVDANTDPSITEERTLASVQVVLTGGAATFGTIAIGDGINK